jgi:hypothetical protein
MISAKQRESGYAEGWVPDSFANFANERVIVHPHAEIALVQSGQSLCVTFASECDLT